MLLLTDRLNEGLRLQHTLGLKSCAVVPLHQALELPAANVIVICDVALDNVTSIDLLRTALSHHRTVSNIPVLCLTRDPSQLTLTAAHSVGATATLPHEAAHTHLISTIKRLTEPNRRAMPDRRLEVRPTVMEASASLSDLLEAARHRQAISAAKLNRGGNAVIAAIAKAKIRAWLDIVWNYDDVTYQHCLLVAGLVAAFALRLGLSLNSQRLLSQAALIHDVGKANIPYKILSKAGHLSAAEMTVMRTHAAIGHDMLLRQGGFDPQLLDIVRHHHEYLDGSGYPDGLRGAQISHFVRLVTICDIYAALIERRSYKAPTPPESALSVLVEMGPKLDEGLVKAFHSLIREA